MSIPDHEIDPPEDDDYCFRHQYYFSRVCHDCCDEGLDRDIQDVLDERGRKK